MRENDDAFIINREGILQTPSRFHGNVLEKYKNIFRSRRNCFGEGTTS